MSDYISKKALLDWLNVEIDMSTGSHPVLKADKWAFEQVKKAVESGKFDIQRIVDESTVYGTDCRSGKCEM